MYCNTVLLQMLMSVLGISFPLLDGETQATFGVYELQGVFPQYLHYRQKNRRKIKSPKRGGTFKMVML